MSRRLNTLHAFQIFETTLRHYLDQSSSKIVNSWMIVHVYLETENMWNKEATSISMCKLSSIRRIHALAKRKKVVNIFYRRNGVNDNPNKNKWCNIWQKEITIAVGTCHNLKHTWYRIAALKHCKRIQGNRTSKNNKFFPTSAHSNDEWCLWAMPIPMNFDSTYHL